MAILGPSQKERNEIAAMTAPRYGLNTDFAPNAQVERSLRSAQSYALSPTEAFQKQSLEGAEAAGQSALASQPEISARGSAALGMSADPDLSQALSRRAQRSFGGQFNLQKADALKEAERRRVGLLADVQSARQQDVSAMQQGDQMARQNEMARARRDLATEQMREQEKQFRAQQRGAVLGSVLGLVGTGAGAFFGGMPGAAAGGQAGSGLGTAIGGAK